MKIKLLVLFTFLLDSYRTCCQSFYTHNAGCFGCAIQRNHEFTDIQNCKIDSGQYNQYLGYGEVHGFPDGSMLCQIDNNVPTLIKSNVPFTWHQTDGFPSLFYLGRYNKNFYKFPEDPYVKGFSGLHYGLFSFTFDYKSRFFFAGSGLYYTELKGERLPILIRPIDSIMQITALSLYYEKLYGVQSFIRGSFFQGTKFRFVEFDRDNNYALKNLFEFEVESDLGVKFDPLYTDICLNTHTVSCDSTVLFLTVGLGHKSRVSLGTFIYIVDLISLKLIPYCSFPKEIALRGLASQSEVAHTKCRFALDLDDNNTTDLSNGYYHVAACPSDSLALHDGDLYLYCIYEIDSMIIEFMNPPPDSSFESLNVFPDKNLEFEYLNNTKIIVRNLGNANTMDFKSCIQNMRYINTNYPVIHGSRMFQISLYAQEHIESAMAEILLPELRPAGGDFTLTVCADGPEIELFQYLEFQKTEGGYWLEKTIGDSGWIKPGIFPEGKYHYVFATSPCYFDTAILEIKYYHTNDFNFGNDTSLCFGDSIILDTKLGRRVNWSNGIRSFQFKVDTSGTYWASYKGLDGCTYSDTITINIPDSIEKERQEIFLCKGERFSYKGNTYQSGQVILDTTVRTQDCPKLLQIDLSESPFEATLSNYHEALPNKDFKFSIHPIQGKIQSIEWFPSDFLTQIDDTSFVFRSIQSMNYKFILRDEYDCILELVSFIKIIEQNEIYIPNIFSPNDNFVNDHWTVYAPQDYEIINCKIYNYWGNVVYEVDQQEIKWDGKFRGKNCVPAVYVYLINYKDRMGQSKYITGDLTLIR